MEKKKITVDIAGSRITLVTDEPEDFVLAVTKAIDSRIRELSQSSFRVTPLDAALLLSVDYLSDKLKAEQKIRSLETQLSLYEVSLRSANAQIEELKSAQTSGSSGSSGESAASGNDGDSAVSGEGAAEAQSKPQTLGGLIDSGDGKEGKIRAFEKYLDSKKSGAGDGGMSREEKIRYIESLLRGAEGDKK